MSTKEVPRVYRLAAAIESAIALASAEVSDPASKSADIMTAIGLVVARHITLERAKGNPDLAAQDISNLAQSVAIFSSYFAKFPNGFKEALGTLN